MTRNPQDIINWTGMVIALGMMVILAFAMWALVYVTVPSENQAPLNQVIGGLLNIVGVIVGWHFGSSSQAKKQADTIDTLAKNQPAPAVPDALVIPPGQSATATATDGGTVITPDGKS